MHIIVYSYTKKRFKTVPARFLNRSKLSQAGMSKHHPLIAILWQVLMKLKPEITEFLHRT